MKYAGEMRGAKWFNPYECMVQQINMMLDEYNA
jgi:hypothetical protein